MCSPAGAHVRDADECVSFEREKKQHGRCALHCGHVDAVIKENHDASVASLPIVSVSRVRGSALGVFDQAVGIAVHRVT